MKNVVLFVVFRLIFDIILSEISKNHPRIFTFFYKFIDKLKRKTIYKWVGVLILLTICAIFVVEFKVNDILSGMIAGFIISLWELGFKKEETAR